ncbi:MAG: acid phosphatase [Methylovulum miyakonense]|uniref:acid phosphatase n=1 Tax=Methylovulum miyakonense TaxID=645578 RepID=UPI003BB49133
MNKTPSIYAAGLLASFFLMHHAMAVAAGKTPGSLQAIGHIVVIYAENRSFDNLYGLFPGADGVKQASAAQYTQIDLDGKPFKHLPPIWASKHTPLIDAKLPNQPFRIDGPPVNLPLSVQTRDLVHRYYQHIEQINGGLNNRFAAISDAGGLAMGYYDGAKLPLWQWAKDYVLADNFFMGAFGGSYLNHQWLVCACTPQDNNAPQELRAQLDGKGRLQRKPGAKASALQAPPVFFDGAFTPDGYSVNSVQPAYQPSGVPPVKGGDTRLAGARYHLPPQIAKTIGDTLSAKGIGWAWYAGGWDKAATDGAQGKRSVIYAEAPGALNFQPHHQPFNYYARFAPGTQDRGQHLKDGEDFLKAIADGTLPPVSFYKPAGGVNEHPGYTNVLSGDQHIAGLLERLRHSQQWRDMAIIVTYDENGGFWDHVPPPKGDRWGPGSRIPAIIISPFAKRGFVDHNVYDTTSIIKFITRRYGLEALPGVRENAGDLLNAFEFK